MRPEEVASIPTLDVERCPPPPELTVGWRLLIEGFPSRLENMERDQRRWIRGSEKLEARYEGPSYLQGVSKVSFFDVERSADLDGFSGAPVFAFEQLDTKTVRSGFAGMMILARYFIDADVIIQSLKKVSANDA
jgi:hypothetical protein